MSWDWEKLKRDHETRKKPEPKKKKSQWLTPTITLILYTIGIIILIIILWIGGRWLSYKINYESQVKKAIIEMVKPEALKEKYRIKVSNEQPQSLKE